MLAWGGGSYRASTRDKEQQATYGMLRAGEIVSPREGAPVGNTEGSALKSSVQIFLTKIRKPVAIMLEVTPFIIGDVFFF